MTDPLDLPSEWSPVVLERVWALIANRLERNGVRASGRLVVTRLDLAERRCVGELLGRAAPADRVSIDLEVLDRLMSERDGAGLVAAVEEVRGEPLVARPRGRALALRSREEAFEAARDWLAAHPDADWPWVGAWLDGLRLDDALLLDPDPTALLRTALEVLWERRESLVEPPAEPATTTSGGSPRLVALTRLAERTAHDAHALDSDRRLSAVVLRALAARAVAARPPSARPLSARGGTELWGRAADQRALWETVGVVTDLVSSTCLTWGLIGPGLPGASHEGFRPVHLTWWDLEAGVRVTAPRDILVCQSPRVLEAIAQARIEIGAICTSGRPNLVVTEVIMRARAGGARLRYHGNLDWLGVSLANDALSRHGAAPWLMSAADYLDAPGSMPLDGSPVEPAWDAELGAAMRRRGVSVHEEATLDHLVDELSMW